MKLVQFYKVFRLYYRFHSARYSAARAWNIVIQGSPF